MAKRFLVVEGNVREARERHREASGTTPSQSYAAVLTWLAPGSAVDIAFPADLEAELPDGDALAAYAGIVLTGSALHAYDERPEVTRQIAFMRRVFAARRPAFGSCWGLQVAAMAAGGTVARNPAGREIGFARNIAPTGAGLSHAMLAGRPGAFDAPTVHLDAVVSLPPDCDVLASNARTAVQAAEIRHEGGVFWGVQYHPEFSLRELAAILDRYCGPMLEEGFFADARDHARYVADLLAVAEEPGRTDLAWRLALDDQVLDPRRRLTEIANFVAAA